MSPDTIAELACQVEEYVSSLVGDDADAFFEILETVLEANRTDPDQEV